MRCIDCGFRARGKNHKNGLQHKSKKREKNRPKVYKVTDSVFKRTK